MTDTPKKTLTLNKKPTSSPPANLVNRSGKRIIRREDLNPTPAKPAVSKGKPTSKPTNKKKPARKPTKKPTIAPSDLKAKELNDRLNAFPVWLNFQPLAIGIDKDLFKLVNDEQFPGGSKKVVQKVLRMHTRHGRYLSALLQGGDRYQLDGVINGAVTEPEQQWAVEKIKARQTA
ncbi:ProQ/FINO family protein [uncultured Thiothrix sp.]|uniref:ProQ/FINO family protein n=1 Tax=uncultured Thiothrix sp. TaxID=223185 RepID=UPI00261533BE|nr:ProQ/FINO family protein [uncultured Thiothrix sp.]